MIDPQDIDPDTGRPYPGYSSPALDTSFHDHEMDVDDDDECTDPRGHHWVIEGAADDYPGAGEGRCYCEHCGADGDA
jgi:hypothetical protein